MAGDERLTIGMATEAPPPSSDGGDFSVPRESKPAALVGEARDVGAGSWQVHSWQNVVISITVLIWMLTVFFALLGLLAELVVHASGMHRRSALGRLLNEQA